MGTSIGKQSIAIRFFAFAGIAGLLGSFFSVMMRAELAHSGMQYFASGETYNVFVTLHVLLLISFSLLPALFFGFGEIALGLRSEGAGKLSRRVANTILALLVLAFMVFLYSAFIEYDIRGRNGVGGGWTVYAPLSTTGKPGNIFSFLSFGMNLGLLALLLVLAAVFLGALRYYSLLFFHVGAIPKSHVPLVWSIALVFLGALLLMPYHVYMIVFGMSGQEAIADPVYTKLVFGIVTNNYTSLLFIIAMGLASTIALSKSGKSVVLVVGMTLLIMIYGCLKLYSVGWVALCQDRVLGCRGLEHYSEGVLWCQFLVAGLLFLLWGVAGKRGKSFATLPTIWLFPVIFFYIGSFLPILAGVRGYLFGLDYQNHLEVGHQHFLGGVSIVFVLFAGFYHFLPGLAKKPWVKWLGYLHFLLMSVGVTVTFVAKDFVQMPRRIADYPAVFEKWNFISSVGSFISAFGLLCFVAVLGFALWPGRRARA